MKKCVAICATLAALAWAGVAAAATPQGKLTGSATVTGFFTGTFTIGIPITDGGTSYVGLENDKSGNCAGDSGTFLEGTDTFTVVCAHYVAHSGCCSSGSPKMRFAYETANQGCCNVGRITDNGAQPDTFALGGSGSFAEARAWVNKGRIGSGVGSALWFFASLTSGDYTVTS